MSILPPTIGTVHLWQACWPDIIHPDRLREARDLLDPIERQRANRFYFERDRQGFICARGMLKQILSGYLNRPASSVGLITLDHGKPALASAGNPHGLDFNLSHSGNRVAIAVATRTSVGVDIECMERTRDWQALADHIFSTQELAELAELSESGRVRGFFNGWTRKEAYLKAVGIGLIDDLKSVVVSLDPEKPAKLVRAGKESDKTKEWLLHSFNPEKDYAGALAIRNPSARVEDFTFSIGAFAWSADRTG